MSLQQEGEQIGGRALEFWKEQGRLTDSARKHIDKALVAGIVTGLTTAVPPHIAGAVVGLELIHQMGAAAVDLRKHEKNKKGHGG